LQKLVDLDIVMTSLLTPTKSRKRGLEKDVHIITPDLKRKLDTTDDEATSSTPSKKRSIKVDLIDEFAKYSVAKEAISNAVYVSDEVKEVYKIVQRATGATGGNGYNGAIYGELTAGSFQKIVNFMTEMCELNPQSRFIDVGSGLGKPNLHVLQSPQVCLSIGVELEEIRWILSMHNLMYYLRNLDKVEEEEQEEQTDHAEETSRLRQNRAVNFICGDIDVAKSLDPFTHIYMYDLGFPPDLQQSIANKFNHSVSPKYLISYRPPHRVIDEYGYQVEAIHQMNTKMCGKSNYFYLLHTSLNFFLFRFLFRFW
jgi:DNA-binding transcriptional MerR regulator